MFFRRKKPKEPVIRKDLLLKLIPLRNPALEWDRYPSGEVYVMVPPRKPKKLGVLKRALPPGRARRIVFDKIGSNVWELCDGKRTVDDIVQSLCSTYKLTRREAEVPLMTHLQRLGRRGFIGLVPREALGQAPPKPPEESKPES